MLTLRFLLKLQTRPLESHSREGNSPPRPLCRPGGSARAGHCSPSGVFGSVEAPAWSLLAGTRRLRAFRCRARAASPASNAHVPFTPGCTADRGGYSIIAEHLVAFGYAVRNTCCLLSKAGYRGGCTWAQYLSASRFPQRSVVILRARAPRSPAAVPASLVVAEGIRVRAPGAAHLRCVGLRTELCPWDCLLYSARSQLQNVLGKENASTPTCPCCLQELALLRSPRYFRHGRASSRSSS